MTDYKAAANPTTPSSPRSAKVGRVLPLSLKWHWAQYYKSSMWAELDSKTQKTRRSILERFATSKNYRDNPFALLLPRHFRKRRDEMMATPEAANSMVKALRQFFRFAILYDHHDTNPATTVELLKSKSSGYHSWTLEEIEKYEETHPVGPTPRLELALALRTGQRRSDVIQFGKQRLSDISAYGSKPKNCH